MPRSAAACPPDHQHEGRRGEDDARHRRGGFRTGARYKGAHSGEHGDGIVRSEFHEPMFGAPIARAFEAVKDSFDPEGLMNPGRSCARPRWTTAR
jgi:FAD/FMN-containing dehydrogenase